MKNLKIWTILKRKKSSLNNWAKKSLQKRRNRWNNNYIKTLIQWRFNNWEIPLTIKLQHFRQEISWIQLNFQKYLHKHLISFVQEINQVSILRKECNFTWNGKLQNSIRFNRWQNMLKTMILIYVVDSKLKILINAVLFLFVNWKELALLMKRKYSETCLSLWWKIYFNRLKKDHKLMISYMGRISKDNTLNFHVKMVMRLVSD